MSSYKMKFNHNYLEEESVSNLFNMVWLWLEMAPGIRVVIIQVLVIL